MAELSETKTARTSTPEKIIFRIGILLPRCEAFRGRRLLYRRGLSPSVSDQRQEFVACLLVMPEGAQHGAGDRLAVLFFDAAHLHAQVARFDDHAHALRADL